MITNDIIKQALHDWVENNITGTMRPVLGRVVSLNSIENTITNEKNLYSYNVQPINEETIITDCTYLNNKLTDNFIEVGTIVTVIMYTASNGFIVNVGDYATNSMFSSKETTIASEGQTNILGKNVLIASSSVVNKKSVDDLKSLSKTLNRFIIDFNVFNYYFTHLRGTRISNDFYKFNYTSGILNSTNNIKIKSNIFTELTNAKFNLNSEEFNLSETNYSYGNNKTTILESNNIEFSTNNTQISRIANVQASKNLLLGKVKKINNTFEDKQSMEVVAYDINKFVSYTSQFNLVLLIFIEAALTIIPGVKPTVEPFFKPAKEYYNALATKLGDGSILDSLLNASKREITNLTFNYHNDYLYTSPNTINDLIPDNVPDNAGLGNTEAVNKLKSIIKTLNKVLSNDNKIDENILDNNYDDNDPIEEPETGEE